MKLGVVCSFSIVSIVSISDSFIHTFIHWFIHMFFLIPGPMIIPVDEEVETRHVKFLQQLPPGMNFVQAVQRFNSNIPYSGLIHAVTQVSTKVLISSMI